MKPPRRNRTPRPAADPGLLPDSALRFLNELLAEVPSSDIAAGEQQARRELSLLPTALRRGDDPLAKRRWQLRRVAAVIAAKSGRTEELVTLLMREFRDGASAQPLVQFLLELGNAQRAAIFARLALASETCRDRTALEALLERAGQPPKGWTDALLEFARAPSMEAWNALHEFTPPEVYYNRIRNSLRLLRTIGVDPSLLFRLATLHGTIPDAIELVESGEVSSHVVAERALGSPAAAMWLVLAAEAAAAQGDHLAVLRHLRDARCKPCGHETVAAMMPDVLEHADAELRRLLTSNDKLPSE